MKNFSVRSKDQISKREFAKDGDFGLAAVGDREGGKLGGPLIEVEFSSLSEQDMSFLLATILKLAHAASPKAVQYALVLFSQAVRNPSQVDEKIDVERMGVLKRGLTTDKSKAGGTDKDPSRKN